MAFAMNLNFQWQRLHDARNVLALCVTTAILSGSLVTSAQAQGVWAEPACGTEPVCGAEPTCRLEPLCGAEPACGCENAVCGCEPVCGAEPACGLEPSCGFEADCGELLGCEKGLLARRSCLAGTPIHGVLDTVACGVEKLVMLRPQSLKVSRRTCHCSSCSASIGHSIETYVDSEPIMLAPQSPSVMHTHSHPAPTLSPAPRMQTAPRLQTAPRSTTPTPLVDTPPKTTIRRDPPALPQPRPLRDAQPQRPGRVFDELTNPFEDDSAKSTSRRQASILRTTFDHEDAEELAPIAATDNDDDYDDYFRE